MNVLTRLIVAIAVAGAPPLALAVTMNFDDVCPSPPCLVAGKYAGVTFSPGTLQIVGPGTDGLTGPAGGAYLSVTSNAVVTSGKDMMTGSIKVSRASTTPGPVTVTIIMTKTGSPYPVAPPFMTTVDSVNQWVDFTFGALVPFDTVQIMPNGAGAIGIDAMQFDVRCFGFADVQPADAFCDAVEWIANRNVTLGCSAGAYCPDATVTRAQMALFMQRLGDAIAPRVQRVDCLRDSTFAPLQRGCVIVVDAASFPRVATANLACGLTSGGATTKTVASEIVASADNGATWIAIGSANYGAFASSSHAGTSNVGSQNVAAGATTHFAYEMVHVAGSAAASVTAECSLVVTVGSRTGTSSPY